MTQIILITQKILPFQKKTEERLSKMAIKDPQQLQTIAQQQADKNRQKLEKKLQASTQSR